MSEHMERLVERLAVAGRLRAGAGWGYDVQYAAVLDVLAEEHAGAGAGVIDERLAAAATAFTLDEVDVDLLWSAAAPDVDANVGIAYGLLRGIPGVALASTGVALELAGVPTTRPDGHLRLGAGGVLVRQGLLEVGVTGPWLTRDLQVPGPVVAALLGGSDIDPAVTEISVPVLPLDLPAGDVVGRAVASGVPLVWVRGSAGSAGASAAAGGLARFGVDWMSVDAGRAPAGSALADALAATCRAAGLAGRAVIVDGADVLAEPASGGFAVLARAAVPVVAVGTQPWNRAWLNHVPLIVDAGPLAATARAGLWSQHLDGLATADTELRQTLAGLRFSPRDIVETARYATALAAAGDGRPVATVVREAARRVGNASGAKAIGVAVPAPPGDGPSFDDLVLPDHVLAQLGRLIRWGRHRDAVDAHGLLRRRGRGISALFAGNPGTGKTLAAHVVAEELSVDLLEVALSTVVDKYIGETEKNLEKVFRAAEALDVVLFFDEADALFGSRSAVNDARDRYANQEIAYLLQRMERFEGITILATNLRGNLDRAFSRRMNFIISFPDPDPDVRRTLWERHLRALTVRDETDPVDVDRLARELELTGGDIRNIVLAAAYETVGTAQTVGMRHITAAAEREYQKLGKLTAERVVASGRQR